MGKHGLVGQLTRRTAALDPVRIVVESTGGYERALVAKLAEAGLPVVVGTTGRLERAVAGQLSARC